MKRHWGRKGDRLGHVMRPRILIYAGVLVAICVAFAYGLATRSTLRVDVIGTARTLSREGGRRHDRQRPNLHVMNADQVPSFALSVSGLDGVGSARQALRGGCGRAQSVTVEVAVPPESGKPGSNTVHKY